MVIALAHHCRLPSSSSPSSSSPFTPERMSSKPSGRQPGPKIKCPAAPLPSCRVTHGTPPTCMDPSALEGAPGAKCLPRLQESSIEDAKRTRRVVVMTRRSSVGSCQGSASSTVVELPGIHPSRRHSVAGTTVRNLEESSLEVFVSPLRRCGSLGDAAHLANSSFRARDKPPLLRRPSEPSATPMPPRSPRSQGSGPAELSGNQPAASQNSYGGSRHFEHTLQKIEETKFQEVGFPHRQRRRKKAVASIDRQYLGGEDYQEFRDSVEGRRYANISEMPIEFAQELLSQQEEELAPPDETEDEQLQQKCLKWLETLPQS